MEKLGQEPAFHSEFDGTEKDFTGMPCLVHRKYYGISKRFYAACSAMQGLLSHIEGYEKANGIELLIADAYEFADELLKQENA